jgi:hypothetical protein
MPKIQYANFRFSEGTRQIIDKANEIIQNYAIQGFDLTLRQLYYQFVARDLIPNSMAEYKRLGSIINDARLAGLIDWDMITDRTRNLEETSCWSSPEDIIRASAHCFTLDKWADQPIRVEAWIEKDALKGVISNVCEKLEIPYFSCRGYVSQSEMWTAARRIRRLYVQNNYQRTVILHLGDHDPSGIDMSRDIENRIRMFLAADGYEDAFNVKRIALNMDQVKFYNPPPNPAKTTDKRFQAYIKRFGTESWELDALEPNVLIDLIKDTTDEFIDYDLWEESKDKEEAGRGLLYKICDNYDQVEQYVKGEF